MGILAEAVLKELPGVAPDIVAVGVEDNRNQLHAVLFRCADIAVTCRVRRTGLNAGDVFVIVAVCLAVVGFEHDAVAGGDHALLLHIGGAHLVAVRTDDILEGIVLHRLIGQGRQVTRGGVMVVVMQTVGIHEVGIGHAKHLGSLVHQLDELAFRPADMLCHGDGCVVTGAEDRAVEKVQHGELLTLLQTQHRGLGIQHRAHAVLGAVVADRDRLVQIVRCQQTQKNGHDLRGGGGVHQLVGILFKDDLARALLDQDTGDSGDVVLRQELGMLRVIFRICGKGRRKHQHSQHHTDCAKQKRHQPAQGVRLLSIA